MLTAWRIARRSHAKAAFTGEGARLYGGRWNSSGTRIIYTAQSQALAVLEMLVHLDSPLLLRSYVLFEVQIDPKLVTNISRSSLPRNWRRDPIPREAQQVGDAWVKSARSAVLAVPSVLVPDELNYLLNPLHADFAKLKIGRAQPYEFDARLIHKR
jgi:RES domain-containing protein